MQIRSRSFGTASKPHPGKLNQHKREQVINGTRPFNQMRFKTDVSKRIGNGDSIAEDKTTEAYKKIFFVSFSLNKSLLDTNKTEQFILEQQKRLTVLLKLSFEFSFSFNSILYTAISINVVGSKALSLKLKGIFKAASSSFT